MFGGDDSFDVRVERDILSTLMLVRHINESLKQLPKEHYFKWKLKKKIKNQKTTFIRL